MNKKLKVRLSGAYFIKAAEGRSSRVVSKRSEGSTHHLPSERERKLAQELLKRRR